LSFISRAFTVLPKYLDFISRISEFTAMAITASTIQIEFDRQRRQVEVCIHRTVDSLIWRVGESQASIGCNSNASPQFPDRINHRQVEWLIAE
jgi:hypothetical protein